MVETMNTTSRLRDPVVLSAIRDVMRTADNRGFRPKVMEMLLSRFQLVPTKGQLNGMLWREGLSVATGGALRETDGAAALALAQRRSREEVDNRRRQREEARAAAAAASEGAKPIAVPVPRVRLTNLEKAAPAAMNPAAGRPTVTVPFSMLAPERPAPIVAAKPVVPVPEPVPEPVPAPALLMEALTETVLPDLASWEPMPWSEPDRPALAEIPIARARGASCLFPLGDVGTPEFHFCGQENHPGRPYCLDHCKAAYQGFKADRPRGEVTASFAGLFPERRF